MVWIWAVVFLITVAVEIGTVELISIWFAFGSLISFILALCNVSETIQVIVFVVASTLLFLSFRNLCMKLLKNSKEKTNSESLIGTIHKLSSGLSEDVAGEIKINGIVWRAVGKDGETIDAGSEVEILEIQGNKFIVKKHIKETLPDNNDNLSK